MSIKDYSKKIKPYWQEKVGPAISQIKTGFNIKEDTFIVLSILLIGLAGFGLGRLSALEKNRSGSGEEVKLEKASFSPATVSTTTLTVGEKPLITNALRPLSAAALVSTTNSLGLLVASKTGKKYHFPWCAGAAQISEKNKIWFDSYESAQKAGYTAASNCPNLQ